MPINRLSKSFDANPRVLKLGIYIGFVKENSDAQRMGRLYVYIPELGGEPEDPGSWVLVSYASPFAGATDPVKIQANSQTYDGSQQSYGLWMVPPDLNNEVAVFFANNDITRGYWFACCFQTNMNHMVPGVATDVTTEPPDPNLHTGPVVEYNKANVTSTTNPRRPRFQPLSDGLMLEGLTYDNERGSSSTSARREAPSQVFGLLSPRANSIHIDDNTSNEFIRMRTRSGTQVLIHETSGYVYINSKNGNSWIEISDAGIDMYTAKSLSMRAEGDFNVRADGNINLDAGAAINLRSGSNTTVAAGGDIQNQAGGKVNQTAGSNIESYATGSILNVTGGDYQLTAKGNLTVAATGSGNLSFTGDLQIKSSGNIRLQSTSDMTFDGGGALRLQSGGDMTQLAGGKQVRDGSTILDNTKAAPPAGPAAPTTPLQLTPPVLPIGLILGDAKQTFANDGKDTTLWKAGANHVNTIVARMPTHEPWRDHPNADVPPPPSTDVDVTSEGTYNDGSGSALDPSTANNPLPDGSYSDSGCNIGVGGTRTIDTQVYNAIMNACTKTGADPATMLAFADMESGFNPTIQAKGSSATGLYQFISGTWTAMVTKYGAKYNVGYSQIHDPVGNALMGGQFMCDNVAILKKNGITDPTPGQIYMVHFAGSGGGPAMILAGQKTPDAPASSLFPAAASANPTIFNGKSISQVVAFLSAKADSKAKAYAGQYGLAPPCDRLAGGTGTSVNMNTAAGGSIVGPVTPGSPGPTVPVGGSGNVVQPISTAGLRPNPDGFCGTTHQCVSLVQSLGLPLTSRWRKGSTDPTTWKKGQAIAIFDSDGLYHSHTNGSSHAAIFLETVFEGNPRSGGKPSLRVIDQWVGQPAHQRIIHYNQGAMMCDNAANYAAINLA